VQSMKNTTLVRQLSSSKKSSKGARGLRARNVETLEIRDLLAANTLDIVDNLSITDPNETRDLQLVVASAAGTGKSTVMLEISGLNGSLDPNVPLIFQRDTDRNNPANHVQLLQAFADVNGSSNSLVLFEVEAGDEFTIQVGGSSGIGDFKAEVALFGSPNTSGTVTVYDYMRSVAAELQGRGAGNHNTAAYFQQIWGIDFNHSQYNVAFDANRDGRVDGHEVGMVNGNMGPGTISLDLIGDNDAPEVIAKIGRAHV